MIEAAKVLAEQVEPEVKTLSDIVTPLDVCRWADEEPPPLNWVVPRWIPRGTVGMLASPGGLGKSFLALQLAIELATASFVHKKPFEIIEPCKVLYLNIEDPENEIQRRFYNIVQHKRYGTVDIDLMRKNLFIFPAVGLVGAMMELDEHKNPTETIFAGILRNTVKAMKPKLVILDTKSRLFGLTENDSGHNSAWMRIFEQMAREFDTTYLILHHLNKEGRGQKLVDVNAVRGGSSQTDDARYILALNPIEDPTQKIGTPKKEYVQLSSIKSNYGKAPEPLVFERLEYGVLGFCDLFKERYDSEYQTALELFENIFNKANAPTSNQLVQQRSPDDDVKTFRQDVVESLGAPNYNQSCKDRITRFINRGLKFGDLEELETTTGNNRKSSVLVRSAPLEWGG